MNTLTDNTTHSCIFTDIDIIKGHNMIILTKFFFVISPSNLSVRPCKVESPPDPAIA
jgi:hypothetical protein